MLIIINKFY